MKLILARHGERVENAARVLQGAKDGKLSELGKEQAEHLAQALSHYPIDKVYASDLGRVQETLAPFRRLHPEIPVLLTEELRELNVGDLEGKPLGSLNKAAAAAGLSKYLLQTPGGESIHQMGDRVEAFAREIIAEHPKETICFYCHGGPITEITMRLLDIPEKEYKEWHPENAEFIILKIEDGRALLVKRRKTLIR